MAVIEIQDLTYKYPVSDKPALMDINLKVNVGEILAIIGPNGAGKSSICYSLAGFIPHFYHGEVTGRVLVAGRDNIHSSLSETVRNVGLVFQNPFNQISGSKFTVYEELAFGLENLGIPRQEMVDRLNWVMQLTGIKELAGRSPYALSGGQQQRVALASILVMQPDVLVLDEPTSQLDPIGTREIFEVVKEMSQRGMTIVLVEHKVEWIAEIADRVIVLVDGKIILEGAPQEVLTSLVLSERGIGISRYTAVARRAAELRLWPERRRLPITLDEAVEGFSQVFK
jgi:energy-coupling factor transport system ATP-binding protein